MKLRRPRMTEEVRSAGLSVGYRRVGRLMRENTIRVVRTRHFKVTTNSSHKHSSEPNLLEQDFSASALNQKWAADITYIWTCEGWVYLTVVLDLFSRRVIGCNLEVCRTADIATDSVTARYRLASATTNQAASIMRIVVVSIVQRHTGSSFLLLAFSCP